MDIEPIGFLVVELNPDVLSKRYSRIWWIAILGSGAAHFRRRGAHRSTAVYRSGAARSQFSDRHRVTRCAHQSDRSVSDEAKRRGHPTLQTSSAAQEWQLVVQHPKGSLDVAVASWRAETWRLVSAFWLFSVRA